MTYRVTLVRDEQTGITTDVVATDVATQRRALALAEKKAGDGATFFARGEGPYRQVGYVGPNGTLIVS